jgi:hypothetical protein
MTISRKVNFNIFQMIYNIPEPELTRQMAWSPNGKSV